MLCATGAAEFVATLQRSLTRWVVLALAADGGLAIVDVVIGRSAVLTTMFLVPPLALALVETGGRVAAVAAVSTALAVASGAWNHYFGTGEHIYRVVIVAGSGVLAVVGAELRSRALSARDRMGLLAEIASAADGRLALDESLTRLADLLVPAVADYCEIITLEPASIRRAVARVAGRPPPLAGRSVECDSDREALEHGEAELVNPVDAAHLSAIPPSPDERQLLAELNLRSAMRVPVRSGDGTHAVLTLAVGPSGRRYGLEDLRFARTVGSRAGLVIENARLLEELHESRQQMEAIVGSLADAVTIRERSGRLVYANHAALASMGIASIDDIVGRDPEALLREYIATDEDGRPLSSAALPSVRLLHGESPDPLVLRYVEPDTGAEQWRVLKATPLYDRDGELEAAVTIIEDVTAAKRAERQTRFLARTSEILASSLDYAETLRNVAWLAVPEVADWCGVDLLDDDGRRRQVVVAHRDPDKLALAERLREYDPVEVDPSEGLGAVLVSGESQLYADLPDELLAVAAHDEEHLRLLRAVGMRSILIVAMRTGGRTVGAMTLVTAESGRRFTDDDVRFAEQVAARAAVAVENARLTINGESVAFPSTLETGWYLEYAGAGPARIFDANGFAQKPVTPAGAVPTIRKGSNQLAFHCAACGPAKITLITQGQPLR